MAGQPRKRKLAEAIEADGGPDAIWDRIIAGEEMKAIAESYGETYSVLYSWIRSGGPERVAAWKDAKRLSADALSEKATEKVMKLDDAGAGVTGPEVGRAKLQADHLMRLAAIRNREEFGDGSDQIGQGLQSIGSAFLQALKARGSMPEVTGDTDEPAPALPGGTD